MNFKAKPKTKGLKLKPLHGNPVSKCWTRKLPAWTVIIIIIRWLNAKSHAHKCEREVCVIGKLFVLNALSPFGQLFCSYASISESWQFTVGKKHATYFIKFCLPSCYRCIMHLYNNSEIYRCNDWSIATST